MHKDMKVSHTEVPLKREHPSAMVQQLQYSRPSTLKGYVSIARGCSVASVATRKNRNLSCIT